ncbi:MAG: hypothetical protein PUF04_09555 [bacterium]|nr:hypothetical protein [bacterium]
MMNEEKNPGMPYDEIPEFFEPRDELDRWISEAGKRYFENIKNEKIEDYELDEQQYQKYLTVRQACEYIASKNGGEVSDAVILPKEPFASVEMKFDICSFVDKDARAFALVLSLCDAVDIAVTDDERVSMELSVRGVYKKKTT